MYRRMLPTILILVGCGNDDAGPSTDRRMLVSGSDMGPLIQNITLARGSSAVSSALVTVNGVVLNETVAGRYSGQLPAYLAVGDTLRLLVVAGADTIAATGRVPAVPTLITPMSGATISIPTPLDFTWIDTSNPDVFRAVIQYNGVLEISSYLGSFRSGVVVTSRIPKTATGLSAYLDAYDDGTFTGPAHPASKMHVRQAGGRVGLVMGP